MPSPFPGMDPYLENPGLWPDVHHMLISSYREMLAAQLRPKYLVGIEERTYILEEADVLARLDVRDPGCRGLGPPRLGVGTILSRRRGGASP